MVLGAPPRGSPYGTRIIMISRALPPRAVHCIVVVLSCLSVTFPVLVRDLHPRVMLRSILDAAMEKHKVKRNHSTHDAPGISLWCTPFKIDHTASSCSAHPSIDGITVFTTPQLLPPGRNPQLALESPLPNPAHLTCPVRRIRPACRLHRTPSLRMCSRQVLFFVVIIIIMIIMILSSYPAVELVFR